MFARTERLLLRAGWADDAPALAEAIGHPHVTQMLAHAPWPYGLDDAQHYLSRATDVRVPQALIFLRTAGKPKLIGGIGLHDGTAGIELWFWIAPPYWGLGFATEAASAVIAMARDSLRLPRLHATHFIDNPASGHVLRKLGFERTGQAAPRTCLARQADILAIDYALDLAAAETDVEGRMRAAPLLAA